MNLTAKINESFKADGYEPQSFPDFSLLLTFKNVFACF